MANNPEKPTVLISGLLGSMATLVAQGVFHAPDLDLHGVALSSDRASDLHSLLAIETKDVILMPPPQHWRILRDLRQSSTCSIAVDFTRPDVANYNAELFAQAGVPFVMGTTGGDREKLLDTVRRSRISAVIAPNMATPMVVVQAMLEYAAHTFPGALEDWRLTIEESHQSTKKDVSGTARAWQPLLEALGARMIDEGIISDRVDPAPHAHHKVELTSAVARAAIELNTRIDGRSAYVVGTLQAVRFLAKKVRAGSRGEVFSMIDVLKG